MFRKPRAAPAPTASETLIRPSTGRPPTPPSFANKSIPQSPPNTTYTMAISTPLVGKHKAQLKRTPIASAGKTKGKANGSGNGNIMSFFKRAESSDTNATREEDGGESLFLEERPPKSGQDVLIQTPTPPREEIFPGDLEMDHSLSRYNEDLMPVKRRKMEEDNTRSPLQETTMAQKVQPTGPFVDDSDEEEVSLSESSKLVNPRSAEGTTISKPVPFHKGESPAKDLQEFPAPRLRRDSTTMGNVTDFEGIEDFIDDEFPEDGEEYMERRWMEEQAELEMSLEEDDKDTEDTTLMLREGLGQATALVLHDAGSSCCPICRGSTAGMIDEVGWAYLDVSLI